MFRVFAHEGEQETVRTAATSGLLDNWLVQVVVFAAVAFSFVRLVYSLSRRSKAVTVSLTLAMFFVVGVAAYQQSPAISVVALTGGFALALSQVLVALGAPHNKSR